MRILISGSSGLIGTTLRRHLAATTDHDVIQLVRTEPGTGERSWDPDAGRLEASVFEGVDAVVNLNGVGIGDRRWTDDHKRAMYDSRIGGTSLLVETMAGLDTRPSVLLSGSGIHIYGDRGAAIVTEASPPGPDTDFLTKLVRDWEAATAPAAQAGVRAVLVRSGLVLAGEGGLLDRLLLPFKIGAGGRLGTGDQWWSWVTAEDWARAATHLLTSEVEGPVNIVAPEPVTNADFTKAMGRVLGRPTVLPLPAIALELALGAERARALAFTSIRVRPERLLDDGFEFAHPDIDSGLRAVLGKE